MCYLTELTLTLGEDHSSSSSSRLLLLLLLLSTAKMKDSGFLEYLVWYPK